MTSPAFLFSGQLAEFAGMGKDFHDSSAEARDLSQQEPVGATVCASWQAKSPCLQKPRSAAH